MTAPSLARMVVSMAESREEVVRRNAGLDDMMDFRVCLSYFPRSKTAHLEQNVLIAFTQNGFEVKYGHQVSRNGGQQSLCAWANILGAHGYTLDADGKGLHDIIDRKVEDKVTSIYFVMKVPRSLVLQNPLLLR
mmetsp:Transcript_73094/g.133822  ORF Transcript_73094/g.133822 Transcript_73094/m.133822 type:complete len:134 (+) Transcript_73094:94-495(+)